MNYRLVLYICGCILKFESAFLLLPAITGIFYQEFREALIYVGISALCIVLGYLCTLVGVKSNQLYPKEGFVAVSLGWIVMSFFGALPF